MKYVEFTTPQERDAFIKRLDDAFGYPSAGINAKTGLPVKGVVTETYIKPIVNVTKSKWLFQMDDKLLINKVLVDPIVAATAMTKTEAIAAGWAFAIGE